MARFLHLSDLHVVPEGMRASGVLDTRGLLQSAIDRLLRLRDALAPLDGVLVTGDISDDGSPESYAFARAELGRLDLPLFVVPGNHDAREPFRTAFADLPGMPGQGLIDWTVTVSGTCLIGLDTLVEGQGGGVLRTESLEFLRVSIENAEPGPVVIMLHHPPIRTGIRFMDAIGLENTSALTSILENVPGPVNLLSGHVHGVHIGRIGQHPVMTAPSTCSAFALDRREDATVGFSTGPTGCAVIDTGRDGLWSTIPLSDFAGPFTF